MSAVQSQNLMNHSLYSGGSSLIGLNYALGQVPANSGKPQEIFVIKIQDREIHIPKIDIARVLQYGEKREVFKNNLTTTVDHQQQSVDNTFSPSSIQLENKDLPNQEQSSANLLDQRLPVESEDSIDAKKDGLEMMDMFKEFKEELEHKGGNDDTLDLGGDIHE